MVQVQAVTDLVGGRTAVCGLKWLLCVKDTGATSQSDRADFANTQGVESL
jgi:hypothetical protein